MPKRLVATLSILGFAGTAPAWLQQKPSATGAVGLEKDSELFNYSMRRVVELNGRRDDDSERWLAFLTHSP